MLKTAASVVTAAISWPRSAMTFRRLSGSFQVKTIRVSASSSGTPGPAATGRGLFAGPAATGSTWFDQ